MQWPTTYTFISYKHRQLRPVWRIFVCMFPYKWPVYVAVEAAVIFVLSDYYTGHNREFNHFYLQSASTIFRVWTCCLWDIYHTNPSTAAFYRIHHGSITMASSYHRTSHTSITAVIAPNPLLESKLNSVVPNHTQSKSEINHAILNDLLCRIHLLQSYSSFLKIDSRNKRFKTWLRIRTNWKAICAL